MATLNELIAQKEALEKQIEKARKAELNNAIEQAKTLIASYGLTIEHLFGKTKLTRKSSGSVIPKYKNPATGETWTGRGRTPKWLQGENPAKFKI